jgi:uncharacterized RDD family membrane protein YckC/type II secretory pathway pseudopilin PulG
MFCGKCGKENTEGAGFCAQCGNRLWGNKAPGSTPTAVGIYAGFWKRFVAYILDTVLLAALYFFIGSYLILLLITWLYYALMESSPSQATLGKMALGIKVVDMQGNRISFLRATGRLLGKILSSLILSIGYIMAAFTSRKQALHDLMADCLVINKDAAPDQVGQPVATGGAGIIIALVIAAVIAVPVIGILAAVALPAYQDYTVRARVYEAIVVGRKATELIDSYVAKHNVRPDSTQAVTPESEYVESIAIDREGAVRVALNIPPIEQGVIILSPQEQGWACSAENVDDRYLPRECRQ